MRSSGAHTSARITEEVFGSNAVTSKSESTEWQQRFFLLLRWRNLDDDNNRFAVDRKLHANIFAVNAIVDDIGRIHSSPQRTPQASWTGWMNVLWVYCTHSSHTIPFFSTGFSHVCANNLSLQQNAIYSVFIYSTANVCVSSGACMAQTWQYAINCSHSVAIKMNLILNLFVRFFRVHTRSNFSGGDIQIFHLSHDGRLKFPKQIAKAMLSGERVC